MSIETLSSVTLETIENYRNAASLAVSAYRAGSQRLVDAVNGTLEQRVYTRTAKVAPQLTNSLSQVRGNVSDIIVKGLDEVTTRSEKAIEVGSNAITTGVTKVAEYAAGLDNKIVVNGIDVAVRLSMPGAQAALAVSAKLAEGADALSRAAAGKQSKPVRAVAGVKKAAVKAKRTVTRKVAETKVAVRRKAVAPRKAVAEAKVKVARATRKVAAAIEA